MWSRSNYFCDCCRNGTFVPFGCIRGPGQLCRTCNHPESSHRRGYFF